MKRIYPILVLLCLLVTSCSKSTYFPANLPKEKVVLSAFDSIYDAAHFAEQYADIQEDSVFLEVSKLCHERFADNREIEEPLSIAFARLRYLYPDFPVPTLHLYVSGFNASVYFVDEENIGIGADLYLGADYPLYDYVVYDYQRYMMRKECIAGDVLSACLFRYFPYMAQKNRLLDQMIYRGKVLYLLSQILDLPENEIIGYTKEQYKWCREYEDIVWGLMLDRRVLFSNEQLLLSSYLNDGPFCSEISQDCPSRIGTWIGMQIVRSYMEHNEDITLPDLMAQHDAQTILEKSYYKP